MNLQDKLNQGVHKILAEIKQAAQQEDISSIQRLTQVATELRTLHEQLSNLEAQIESVLGHAPKTNITEVGRTELRRLPVQVTGGMIRQSLLALTEHVKQGRIKVGEQLSIEVQSSGEKFKTELLENSYKLQERGAIGRFYKIANINEGDIVVLIETGPERWILQKGQSGEWDGHYRYKRVHPV